MTGETVRMAQWPADVESIEPGRPVVTFDELHAEYLREIAAKVAVERERDEYSQHAAEGIAEIERLRRRTHEIQEAADKRYSELTAKLRNWERWGQCRKAADDLLTEPGIAFQSMVVRTCVTDLLVEQARLQALVEAQGRVIQPALAYYRAYMAGPDNDGCTDRFSSGSHDDHDCLVSLHARALAAVGALDQAATPPQDERPETGDR